MWQWVSDHALEVIAIAIGGGTLAGASIGAASLRFDRRERLLGRLNAGHGLPNSQIARAVTMQLRATWQRDARRFPTEAVRLAIGELDDAALAVAQIGLDAEPLGWVERLYVDEHLSSLADYSEALNAARSGLRFFGQPDNATGYTDFDDEGDWAAVAGPLWRVRQYGFFFERVARSGSPSRPRVDADVFELSAGIEATRQRLRAHLIRRLRHTLWSRLRAVPHDGVAVARWLRAVFGRGS